MESISPQTGSADNAEDKILKTGYLAILQERHPLNDDPNECLTRESAYFLTLEQEYLQIPEELTFETLEEDINPKHRERLREIWQAVQRALTDFLKRSHTLQQHWRSTPKTSDESAKNLIASTPIKLQDRFRQATIAIISTPSKQQETSRLEDWQATEKDIRNGFNKTHKNFIVALRIYYEMLLETSDKNNDKNTKYVLPKNHPRRQQIVIHNRYLRLIDATYQGIATAKLAHHHQRKKRTRKTAEKPALFHALEVTTSTILDTIPHTMEGDTRRRLQSIITAVTSAIHDVLEDTTLSLEDLREFLKSLTDKYDSSLMNIIERSGFIDDRTTVKRRYLDIIGRTMTRKITQIIRIISNNTSLTDTEKKKAIKQNIAGFKTIKQLLGINEKDLKGWSVDTDNLPKPAKTFQQFPEEYDGSKLTGFLIRLNAITTSHERKQQTLIVKAEDRRNNIEALKGMPTDKRLSTLRTTTTRLIAWIMLDHNNKKYPLFNALPRLIEATLKAYKELQEENPEAIEQIDNKCIAQLEQWKVEAITYEIPPKVKAILDQYDQYQKAKAA